MNRITSPQKRFRALAAVLLTAALAACNQGAVDSASSSAPAAAGTASTSASASTAADPISFAAANYSVSQSQGSVTLRAVRTGPSGSAISVDYATVNGTASAGTYYTAKSGTLRWTENDTTPASITIPISNAQPFSGTKSFKVVLTDPRHPAAISSPGTATVTISGDANDSAGSLRFSSSGYRVARTAGSLKVTVDRVGGATGAVSVAYETQSGTAGAGTNYTAKSGILQWSAGDATAKTFTVPIATTPAFSGTKLFSVRLSDPTSGASLGTPSTALVTINGEGVASAGDLSLSAGSYSVSQSAGSVTIAVERTGSSSGAASVEYSTTAGTAPAGTAFTAKSGTLQWASGDASPKTFQVAISDAAPFSGNETFTVALTNPSAGASIVSPGRATVTIVGSAAAPVGSLTLSGATYAVSQGAGEVTVTVDRTGGSSGAASVKYATGNGSAVAGNDYTAENGTLSWVDGSSSPHTFTIPISNATPFSGNKSFAVTLSAASGATLATPSTATVTISGDAEAAIGSLQLSAATYQVSQSNGVATVTVNRTGGSAGSISVGYSTSNGTAVAGTDYTGTSGTLDWADGDGSSKSVQIPLSNATPFAGSRAFTLALSNPTSGATLGSPSSTTVNITGSSGQASAPSAPSNLLLVNQGGPNDNDSNSWADALTNYQAVQWSPATPGAYPIDHYEIYRNGTAYASLPAATKFQGYISGNTLTVTSVSSGTIIPGPRWSGTGVAAGTMINAPQLSGTPGGVGTYQVNVSQSVGSASSPVTFSAWIFIDEAATGANDPKWATPGTIYSYAISAVDTQGQEGPQTSQYAVYGYLNGFSNWNGNDLSYGGEVSNYSSANGNPQGGPYDLEVDFNGGGLLAVAAAPQAPVDDLELGAFKYLIIDVNPGATVGYTVQLLPHTRLPFGDTPSWAGVDNLFAYGPAPIPNTWATYKIPLSALGIGKCTFTGSISGTKLTVTAIDSGPAIVNAGGFVTGPGIPAGTYISNYNQSGAIGTFTLGGPGINSSTSVPVETMTYQDTALYKIGLQASVPSVKMYVNNLGWTKN